MIDLGGPASGDDGNIPKGKFVVREQRKQKSEYTPDEILALDRKARAKGKRPKFGSSKHRGARVQAFVGKQRKKRRKRKHR